MWELDQIFNAFEGILWIMVAGVVGCVGFRQPRYRRVALGTGATFILFGISDFIEIHTRAWYSPWTLLALKALCVLSLIVHFLHYRKISR
jgi:CHASE2 domain-containing sensor protein